MSNPPIDLKLEAVTVPVADVDRAKEFYGRLGWRLDADFSTRDGLRGVQYTPPGSPCSIVFGKGLTTIAPGTAQGLFLVVSDIEEAGRELSGAGVEVSDVFHFKGGLQVVETGGRAKGPHPERRSYGSYVTFRDPDGNGWLVQEVKARLPGRGLTLDLTTLIELLREAEARHGAYDADAPKHWSTWYAGYIIARERGKTPDEAERAGASQVSAANG